MKNILVYIIFSWCLYLGISCTRVKTPESQVSEEHHEDEHGSENIAFLTKDQIKSIGIELGIIENKQLTDALKTNGRLKVPNQYKANINTIYSGIIKTLLIQPGTRVVKGQVIASLQNPEFIQIQEEYITLNSKIELAQLELTRQEQLIMGNAGALKNLQSVQSEFKALRTRKSSLHQQLQLMDINPDSLSSGILISTLKVRAPISGTVSEVLVDMGSYVDLSTPIAKIIGNNQLHLDLFVFEKDIPKIKNNQIIHFTLTNNPGQEYDAQIFSLGSTFEGESKVVSVHAKVQGDKTGLIDGMNVTAIISLNQATFPSIPSEAIVSDQGQDYIFVVAETTINSHSHAESEHDHSTDSSGSDKHPETVTPEKGGLTFEKIPIARGVSDIGYTQITLLKDLPKDTKIVVKGAFFVLAKLTNTGEHSH